MITVSNLKKSFGPFTVVNDVSFQAQRGEVLGFLGPNGAGKSTTMKIITGFLLPDSGAVSIAGISVFEKPMATKKMIGYLPEGAPLYGDMTPLSFLKFVAKVHGLNGSKANDALDKVIDQVNLSSVLAQPIDTLSKGFKRRVGLAQAIIHDPDVLILDEPTDGLDPNQKHEVRELIQNMAADKVIVLSTHILEEVDAVCSRAVVIANGSVVADGTPEALASKAENHNAVTLTVQSASAADLNQALEKISSVSKISRLDDGIHTEGDIRVRAFAKDGASIIGEISQLVRDKNWSIAELSVEQGRMDQVFGSLTSSATRV
ncbi:MAG: ATP-binding cassette domain-containing protein [Arenicellales bacterium WSBS_2016_MAG_OTU3]